MKKYILLVLPILLMSCSTNKALVEYNTQRMDRNEAYLKSMEDQTVPRGETEGAIKRVPLEKEAEKWGKSR